MREAGVYSEVHPFRMTLEAIKNFAPQGIILSGGPSSVHEDAAPTVDVAIFDLGIPVLGICYGEQLICNLLGGHVVSGGTGEFGRASIEIIADSALFRGFWKKEETHSVWMSHGDKVEVLPEGFSVTARSSGAPHAAIADEKRRIYGVQFHPEVAHTSDGAKLLTKFCPRHLRLCGGLEHGGLCTGRNQSYSRESGHGQSNLWCIRGS